MSFSQQIGVNELNEIVISQGTGSRNIVGYLPIDFIPTDVTGALLIASSEGYINLASYAKTNTDQTAQIQQCFTDATNSGKTVFVPAGTFLYSGLLTVGCSIVGVSEYHSKFICSTVDGDNSRFNITGNNLLFEKFSVESINSTSQGTETASILRLTNVNNYSIRNMKFVNSKGAPILQHGCTNGRISNIEMVNCWKDGIHFTKACSDIVLSNVTAINAGDDVVALVGYVADGVKPKNITISNIVINGTKSARGIALVGCSDVTVSNVSVKDAYVAGIYIASESGFNTYANENISISNFTLKRCGRASSYAALQITSRASNQNSNITISNGHISDSAYRAISTGGGASGLTQNLSINNVFVYDTTDISNKNGSGVGVGNYSGMEFGYVNNLSLKDVDVTETGGYGIYVANTCTGVIRVDAKLSQINKNGAASNDVVQIQSSSGASRIFIDRVVHGLNSYTVERLVECNNPSITTWGKVYSESGKAIVTGFTDSSISVTGSPFTYQNTSPNPVNVSVQGGTVSAVAFSRDGTTFYNYPNVSGIYMLQQNERMRVTYSVAPTMTSIPSV